MNRILIIEDDERVASFIEKGLTSAGFSTLVVESGAQAARIAVDESFDLAILDLGLPGLGGHDVLRQLRAQGQQVPIIVLTARNDVEATVTSFDLGADDFMTKPFRFDELVARVRARLRAPSSRPTTYKVQGDISLDVLSRRVTVDGTEHELSAREFALTEVFLDHPDQVLSRAQLLNRVWGLDFDPGSNVVDVYVGYLRKKLGPEAIETVRGAGYRLRTG
ncbi:MAG: response regulator transcription factor [Actinomycetota bacterium]